MTKCAESLPLTDHRIIYRKQTFSCLYGTMGNWNAMSYSPKKGLMDYVNSLTFFIEIHPATGPRDYIYYLSLGKRSFHPLYFVRGIVKRADDELLNVGTALMLDRSSWPWIAVAMWSVVLAGLLGWGTASLVGFSYEYDLSSSVECCHCMLFCPFMISHPLNKTWPRGCILWFIGICRV